MKWMPYGDTCTAFFLALRKIRIARKGIFTEGGVGDMMVRSIKNDVRERREYEEL